MFFAWTLVICMSFVHHVVTIYTRNVSMKVGREEGGRCTKPHDQSHVWEQDQEKKREVYAKGSRTRMEEEEWEREETGSGTTHSLLVYAFTQLLP